MTILYVNGDAHSAGAYAANDFCFSDDDARYFYRGRRGHPANIEASFGSALSLLIKSRFVCEAEGDSSNDRIMRTTQEFLAQEHNEQVIVLIGWAGWDNEEWEYLGKQYQISENQISKINPDLEATRTHWYLNLETGRWANQARWHEKIWKFHEELQSRMIPHLFFNSERALDLVQTRKNWKDNYLDPYSVDGTYRAVLESQGFEKHNNHFRADAHKSWARHLLTHLTRLL